MKAFVFIVLIGLALTAYAPKRHSSLHEANPSKIA
jgi:hypothetical protein